MEEETIIHPETGEILYRDVRPVKYTYKGEFIIVDQPGWYPKNGNDNDGILSQDDMKVAGDAVRIMKARHQQKLQADNFVLGDVSFA